MEIKQIIIITDGKSNIGIKPEEAAKEAANNGIAVSVIGIVDEMDEGSLDEIKRIAEAGKGIFDLVTIDKLSYSMQMVTRRTVHKTIAEVVDMQLKEMIGESLQDIHPKFRGQIIEYIEKLSDESDLRCVILIDTSGSMAYKLDMVKYSTVNLLKSFSGRKGKSSIAVISYPGLNGELTRLISGFTDNPRELERFLKDIKAEGGTPTGPAIFRAIELFDDGHKVEKLQKFVV